MWIGIYGDPLSACSSHASDERKRRKIAAPTRTATTANTLSSGCRSYFHNTTIWLVLVITLLNSCCVQSIAIDNDIVGEPEIECMEENIRFYVNTRKYFAGRFYAKGKAEVPGCLRADYSQQRTNKPHWDIPFGTCGMRGLRSLDPRGMYYGITVVVSFHPLFITKVDQAFHVKCFFEESNRGLTAELGVSMIPTTEVLAKHTLPGCTYSMHKSTIRDLDAGRPAGEPVKFARVGDKVLHQWACDDPMFGVLINNCYVTDGFGQRAEVVDQRGCPIDPILITGIRYSADLMRAYAESHVFKFADKPGVWFFCQIQMCMKAAGMCQGISPPVCDGSSIGGPVGGYIPSTIGPAGTPRPLYPYTLGGQPGYINNQVNNNNPNTNYNQVPLTAFAPAFPPPTPAVPNQPVFDNFIDLKKTRSGVPIGGLSKSAFEVTTTYDTEIPLIFEQSDTPGVGIEDAKNGGWMTTPLQGNDVGEDSVIDVDRLLEALPEEFRENDVMKKFIMEHKEDQKFLMNALYKARNPDDDNVMLPGDRIDSFDVTMLSPAMDEAMLPEIAGQLIIFDLDEDPPVPGEFLNRKDVQTIEANGTSYRVDSDDMNEIGQSGGVRRSQQSCVISSRGLLTLVSGLGGLAAFFMFSTCGMCMRYCRRAPNKSGVIDEYDQKALPYSRYSNQPNGQHSRGREKSRKPGASSGSGNGHKSRSHSHSQHHGSKEHGNHRHHHTRR